MTGHEIEQNPAFVAYRSELALWLSGQVDDDQALVPAGTALCDVARGLNMTPEQLLIAIRGGRPAPVFQEGSDRAARESQARAHRYTLAINLLLDCYFK
jgi:hypothetical protein